MVNNGFAASLEHPGGHVTGMDELPPGVTAKRVALLKMAAPIVSRIALLSTTPGRGGHETQLADAEKAATDLGVSVKPYRATSLAELETALTALANDGMNGLVSFPGCIVVLQPPTHRRLRGEARSARNLPSHSVRRSRRSDGLGAESPRAIHHGGALCRSNPKGSESGRPADTLSFPVLSDHQRRRGQGPRAGHSGGTARPSRPPLAVIDGKLSRMI